MPSNNLILCHPFLLPSIFLANSFYLGVVTLINCSIQFPAFQCFTLLKIDEHPDSSASYKFDTVLQELDQLFTLLKLTVSSQSFLILCLSLRKLTQAECWKVLPQVIQEVVVLLLLLFSH